MSSRVRVVAAIVALAVTGAACSFGGGSNAEPGPNDASTDTPETSENAPSILERPPAPPTVPSASDVDSGYEFSRLGMTAGGWVTGLVIHPDVADIMYARTDVGGAYRWNVATAAWEQMLSTDSVVDDARDADFYAVEGIAVAATDPDVVYMSVGDDQPLDETNFEHDGRVLSSTDGGDSWTVSSTTFYIAGNGDFRQQGERIAVDPLQADVVMLGTRREGLWRSDDAGVTFEQVDPTQIPVASSDPTATKLAGVSFVTPDPARGATADGRTARWYAGVAGVGVMRSDDAGDTWTQIIDVEVSIVPQEGQVVDGRLYVAFNDPAGVPGSLQRYDPDEGWFTYDLQEDITIWSVAVDPTNPDRLFVVSEAVRYGPTLMSEDGGVTWTNPFITTSAPRAKWIGVANTGTYMPIGRLVFDPHDAGRIWFAEGIGVWTTLVEPERADWEFAGNGIDELVVADFVAPPGGTAVSAVADFQGFQHSDPIAVPETPLVDGDFAGGTSLDYVGGAPENLVWIGAEYNRYFSPDRRSRAARSADGGATWEEIPNLELDMFAGNIAVSATDPDNMVWVPSYLLSPFEFIDIPKGIFATTDGGQTWTHLPDVGGTNRFHRLMWWFARQALTADKVEPNTFYLFDDEEHFFVSTNGGLEWVAADHAPPCNEQGACHVFGQLRADPSRGGVVWAGVGFDGLYRSDDAGVSEWLKLDAVDEVTSFGFGAPIAPSTVPTIFLRGKVGADPEPGVWRSVDDGETFQLIARSPMASFDSINVVDGDMEVPGRVYVGFGGTGAVFGDDTALS